MLRAWHAGRTETRGRAHRQARARGARLLAAHWHPAPPPARLPHAAHALRAPRAPGPRRVAGGAGPRRPPIPARRRAAPHPAPPAAARPRRFRHARELRVLARTAGRGIRRAPRVTASSAEVARRRRPNEKVPPTQDKGARLRCGDPRPCQRWVRGCRRRRRGGLAAGRYRAAAGAERCGCGRAPPGGSGARGRVLGSPATFPSCRFSSSLLPSSEFR